MYNHLLDTFVMVAEEGSFAKASAKLYISTNAVTKQMNVLEQQLGLKLLERDFRGVTLTDTGRLIYENTQIIIKRSEEILKEARYLEERNNATIRIGFSSMNPVNHIVKAIINAPEIQEKFHIVFISYEDNEEIVLNIIRHFGKTIDILPCPYDSLLWDQSTKALHLCDIPISIAVPVQHPFAKYEKLTFEDLYEQDIIISEDGFSVWSDTVNQILREEHPRIRLHKNRNYDYRVYNTAIIKNMPLISSDYWKDYYPQMVHVPMDWPLSVPFGLLYGLNPSKEVREFIRTAKRLREQTHFTWNHGPA